MSALFYLMHQTRLNRLLERTTDRSNYFFFVIMKRSMLEQILPTGNVLLHVESSDEHSWHLEEQFPLAEHIHIDAYAGAR